MVDHQLAKHERDESDYSGNRDHRDPHGGKPIFFLALVEHDLQQADSDGQHADAPIGDSRWCTLEVSRVEALEARHNDGREADRHVDVEDPAPAVAVSEPAAEN